MSRGRVGVYWGLVLAAPAAATAQERSFHGLYLGAELAREHFIGGSLVGGMDVLAEDTRGVVSVMAGGRYQAPFGLVLGAEGTWGRTDGDLVHDDPAAGLRIEYANDAQTSIGAMIGYAVEARIPVLVFVHASEVTRNFDVHVTQGAVEFDQRDEQGQLRFGVGVEVNAISRLNVRLRAGTGRADFGDADTNITPEKRLQYGLGVTFQF